MYIFVLIDGIRYNLRSAKELRMPERNWYYANGYMVNGNYRLPVSPGHKQPLDAWLLSAELELSSQ